MRLHTLWPCLLLSVLSILVRAQGPVQTFFPAAVPLTIRSPYLSVWYSSTNGSNPISNSWPLFWGQAAIMGWAGKIRVDGRTYAWLGNDPQADVRANVTNIQITPTRSIFVLQAGPMNVTVTYLSPIEPSDWVKQSLPFSYVSVEAQTTDNAAHSVQVYSDISPEWVSGDRSGINVQWSMQTTANSIYMEVEPQVSASFSEVNHQASDGKAYYAASLVTGLTWTIDTDTNSRSQFQQHGTLTNSASQSFGPMGKPWYVFAISVDLGNIQSTSEPVTWAVGYIRNPSVNYITPNGAQQQRVPYFTTQYTSISDAIDAFTGDFSSAHDRAVALDQKIVQAAAKISSNYVDLVSLAARQTVGSLDITTFSDSSGKVNSTDVMIFMKDIGTSTRVNPVERMYAALPALLYFNASLLGPMLKPLLLAQDALSGQLYAAQDLGAAYPNATGNHNAHNQGIEESGNMLIMMLAHARISGDGSLLAQHYNLTRRWADYLVNNTLTPTGQDSADHNNRANQTNLAIKGIIGVKAMAEISRIAGQDFDAQQYDSHASALIGLWQSLAMASNNQHLLGVYGNQPSWSLLYNIYADKLLQTNLLPQSLLDQQTQFLSSQLTTAPPFGLPIDDASGTESSAAWTLLASAIVSDPGVRDQMIQGVWSRINSNLTTGAFPDHYDDSSGNIIGGAAGPGLGAMFSHLALTVPNKTIDIAGPSSSQSGSGNNGQRDQGDNSKHSNVGAIVGGVVGGLAVVAIAAFIFFLLRKHRNRGLYHGEKLDIMEASQSHTPSFNPYFYTDQATGPVHASFHGENGSGYAPVSTGSRSETTGGIAGVGAAGGAGVGMGMGMSYDSPDANASDPNLVHAQGPALASGAAVPMSSKARERALNMNYQYAASVSGSSAVGSQANSASSRDPLSPGSGSGTGSGIGSGSGASASLSPTDVVGLRAEVENLRRVMQEIRAERLEPPPEYVG